MKSVQNFAMTGVAGYIAPRHLKAIKDTGNRLVAAVDPHDAVGILDRYSFDVRFFTEIERFDRHLEKLRRGPGADRVDYVSICRRTTCMMRTSVSPCASGRIWEGSLVISPWNLDALHELSTKRAGDTVSAAAAPELIAGRGGSPARRRRSTTSRLPT